jgi:hypothetical protein
MQQQPGIGPACGRDRGGVPSWAAGERGRRRSAVSACSIQRVYELMRLLAHADREEFHTVLLDVRERPIKTAKIAEGSLTHVAGRAHVAVDRARAVALRLERRSELVEDGGERAAGDELGEATLSREVPADPRPAGTLRQLPHHQPRSPSGRRTLRDVNRHARRHRRQRPASTNE